MKKIVMTTIGILFYSIVSAQQTPEQIDSTNAHIVDSIYNIKSSFIGKPFAFLLDAIGKEVSFSMPPGNRKTGMGYYNSPSIFFADTVGIPSRGFGVTFAQRMPVDLGKMWAVGLDQWDILMRTYLRTAIITAIDKID